MLKRANSAGFVPVVVPCHHGVDAASNDLRRFKMMNFALKMMNFALKMMSFALKMMSFALTMMSFALKMMNSVAGLQAL